MTQYRHHVSGFFAHREEAESALARLRRQGIPSERLQLLDADSTAAASDPKTDGACATAIGTGIGALAQVAIVAGSLSLFIARPLVAPLVMLGWGASLGGFIGATAGARAGVRHKEGWLSDLVRDAIASGQAVLVADTRNKQETAIARLVIEAEVGESRDLRVA